MKCYIYVTKSEPYLWKYHCISDDYSGNCFEISYSKKEYDSTYDGEILNGKIVACFDLNKVEKIKRLLHIIKPYELKNMIKDKLFKASCLDAFEMYRYLKGKIGYAWHIENLKILDEPLGLYDCLKRYEVEPNFTNVKHMLKAPQSWCYAEIEDEECILISIMPEWVCKILNGEKTIEVRKTAPKELVK